MDQPRLPMRIEDGRKKCIDCNEWKSFAEFHRKRNAKDGRQSRCRPCNIKKAAAFYAAHPELCRDRMYARARRIRDENRVRLYDYLLAHPCTDCGEEDPVVLEFDHLRNKKRNVSALVNVAAPWRRILAEIEKCEVVCANCHRRRTCERVQSYRVVLAAAGRVADPSQ